MVGVGAWLNEQTTVNYSIKSLLSPFLFFSFAKYYHFSYKVLVKHPFFIQQWWTHTIYWDCQLQRLATWKYNELGCKIGFPVHRMGNLVTLFGGLGVGGGEPLIFLGKNFRICFILSSPQGHDNIFFPYKCHCQHSNDSTNKEVRKLYTESAQNIILYKKGRNGRV